ncbi:G5 domain-containing protein [Enterococcus casseliflavus]|uniref:ZmpA/ZmpB/ZmpC family metallo-endopeptidase n=1 Tax=Enterococcus casseliflavus TaxID=37734 RepID=UPI002DBE6F44|nr:ZmpA/ZmpB/ZmpC family metallo-endopeptidase [Enterococcus casseliflavus]MEB8418513.1 G5 domain-containing protein [Enterococcus casseliflavus]
MNFYKKRSEERVVKYALRKLSQGLFSVAIGSCILISQPNTLVSADAISETSSILHPLKNEVKIELIPILSKDLSNAQKETMTKELPKVNIYENQKYYMVYSKKEEHKANVLPQTNELETLKYVYLGTGIFLFSWALLARKAKKNKFLLSLLVSSSLSSIPIVAKAEEVDLNLDHYNQTIYLEKGQKLPFISTEIPGYEFLGYVLIDEKPAPSDTKEPVVTTQKETKGTTVVKEETVTETLPYTTKMIENPELEEGVTLVKTAGQDGTRTIVYEVTYDNEGKEISRVEISSTVTKEPVEEVIEKGMKVATPITEEKEEVLTEAVPFTTTTVENPELEEGVTRVQTTGQDGIRTIVYKVTYDREGNEISRVEVSNEVTTAPVAQIIEKGTKVPVPVTEEKEEVLTEAVPYTTTTVENPELEEGVTRVKTAGQDGIRTIVYKVTYDGEGNEISRVEVSNEVTTAPITQIIEKGTKVATPITEEKEELVTEAIPFTTTIVENPELEEGLTQVKTAGENGIRSIVYRVTYDELGNETGRVEVSNTVTKEPVEEVIEKGTKVPVPVIEEKEEVLTEAVPFTTTTVENPELEEGVTRVKTAGQDGIRTIVYKVTYDGEGNEISRVEISNEVTTAPVEEVIEQGTKPNSTTTEKEEVVTEEIPYQTETIDDPSLDLGEMKVQVEGENGSQTITYRITYDASGTQIDKKEISRVVTKEPVKRVILRGTKVKAVDRSALEQLIQEAKTYQENQYTADTWKVFTEQLANSETVVENEAATQEEIDQSVVKLNESIQQLKTKVVNKENLQQLINQAKGYKQDSYTTDSWSSLSASLQKAEGVMENAQATQEEVNQAVTELQQSIQQLKVKVVNKEELQKLIDQVKGYEAASYTTDSWAPFSASLQKAEGVMKNSQVTQEEVDKAASELQQAIDQLKKIQAVPVVTLVSIDENIDQKSATIHYEITDTDDTLQSIQVKVYQNQALKEEKTVDLRTHLVVLNNLAYNTPYTLETIYTYKINQESIKNVQKEKETIELVPKKLEITNFNSLKLFKVNDNGSLTNIIGLKEVPQDLANYIVQIDSVNNKDILLPIHKIQEVTENGEAKYKVTLSYPELVTYDSTTNDFIENYAFYINKIIPKENVYTTFSELVNAINNNPSGTFTIGADLSASEVVANGDSYITEVFTGTLESETGKVYTIYNLNKPLFNAINNGTVKNIHLVDVSITGNQSDVGSLAKTADHATIENVHAIGKISSIVNAGGLLYKADNTTMNDSSFTGEIKVTGTNNYALGGLVGLFLNSIMRTSYADVNIYSTTNHTEHIVGGLVARAGDNSQIYKSYAAGEIYNSGNGGSVGGILGSAWWNGRLTDVISFVKVNNGSIIHGNNNYTYAPFNNVYFVQGVAKGNSYTNSSSITEERAKELINQWGIKTVELTQAATMTDYSYLYGYQKERETAYRNMEKLIPLYDRYTILHYGNLVDPSSKLYTTQVLSVTSAKDHQVITDVFEQLSEINQLLIHYSDGTAEWLALSNESSFKNTKLVEFQLGDNLIYTPMQFQNNFGDLLNQLQETFKGIEFLSTDMLQKFGFMWTDQEIKTAQDQAVANYKKNDKNPELTNEKEEELRTQAEKDLQESKYNKLRDMYLWESFDAIKKNLNQELRSILVNSTVVDMNSEGISKYLLTKLKDQAQNLLLGLTYVNRLYNINYGDVNTKELAMYRTDFYGFMVDNLDWLISFGNMSYESLQVKNNYSTYGTQFSTVTGKTNLIDYLDYNRQLFAPNMDENDWFKAATKAFVYEAPSKEVPDAEVKIYPRLKGKYNTGYRGFILPLLNLTSNNVFIVTNMSTITFGLYERYIDEALKKTPEEYAKKVEEFEKTLAHYGDLWAGYYDTWYRIVDEKVKSQLYTRDIPVWDGYWIIDQTQGWPYYRRWVGRYDTSVPAMVEFFGAIGKWYDPNGTGAYANGYLVHFVVDAVVSDYGTSTLTHEMTHNFDGGIYFNGYGRRDGEYAENFAMGLLQSPYTKDSSVYGLNMVYEWPEASLRSQNYNPSIFQNAQDLYDYMHGVFDVTYLLDYVEADVTLSQSKDDQKLLYRKLIFDNGSDKVVDFTEEEWKQMDLKTVNDLIDNSVVSKRYYGGASVGNNSYYEISMYAPIYSALQNSNGASGGIVFRKTAYELLAAKGWTEGFVPYVSNQYKEQAKTEGKTFSDVFIIEKIFGDKYEDYAAFKKAMFKERSDKKNQIKSITVQWNGQNNVINNYNDLRSLFEIAITYDLMLAQSNKNMHYMDDLKAKIMQAYHLLTNDFEESIFK